MPAPSTLIFYHPTLPERRLIGGFNWLACITPTLWALSEGLIWHGRWLLVSEFAFAGLLAARPAEGILLVGLPYLLRNLWVATQGSHWLIASLLQQGYRQAPANPFTTP
ncbi:hypothetical protein [Vogesella oryzae]|uniref:hypothetical protein n=1 Tax=Vogesella oryzae TaxID=1735285 RepID=UPI001582D1D5|nr:hypothetical protein [Vogesella oryzae]